MADDKQNYTKTGIDQSRDIVTRLRTGRPSAVYDIAQHAADEIERLGAELEQANINLQHARTGKALLDLEQERARTAHLRSAFAELTELCQRLLTERFNDMTEGVGDTPTSTPSLTRIDL